MNNLKIYLRFNPKNNKAFIEVNQLNVFERSILFQSDLKAFIKNPTILKNPIYLNEKLTIGQLEKIKSRIVKWCHKRNNYYEIDKNFESYIKNRNLQINKRKKLGENLKQDTLPKEFNEKISNFSNVISKYLKRTLRDRQKLDSFFMSTMKRSANFSVPGSGKTSSVLGVFAFLLDRKKVNKIVMIGPKNSFGPWKTEFKLTFSKKIPLKLFDIHKIKTKHRGHTSKNRAIKRESIDKNLLLFNYEGVAGNKDILKFIVDDKTLLVFDEIHRIKAKKGKRFIEAFDVSRKPHYMIAMTGTPIPNGYIDIMNMLQILFFDDYYDFFGFNEYFLKNPSKEEQALITKKLYPFFCRTSKEDLQVNPAKSDQIIKVTPNDKETKLIEMIIEKYKDNFLALFIRILQVESDPKMILQKMDQKEQATFNSPLLVSKKLDNKEIFDESEKNFIKSFTTTKKFEETISKIQSLVNKNKSVIVWCIFKHSIKNFRRVLKELGYQAKHIYGDVDSSKREKILDDFRNEKIKILITNPHTLAESISLHQVCHDAIYFEYSYNLVHLLQSKDRIHRLGIAPDQYTQYWFLQNTYNLKKTGLFSFNKKIYDRLKEKENLMLGAVKKRSLELLPKKINDLDFIFEELNL